MQGASFKQFSIAYEAYSRGEAPPADASEVIIEVFGIFKSDEKRVSDLLALVKRGDKTAASELQKLLADLDKKKKLVGSIKQMSDEFQKMKERMRSAETAAVAKANQKPTDNWSHVGKHH